MFTDALYLMSLSQFGEKQAFIQTVTEIIQILYLHV